MGNVDVEIYMNNFIRFFEKNPEDLKSLIGNTDKQIFFEKVKTQIEKNLEIGDGLELTQKQILEICVDINQKQSKVLETKVFENFINTKYGKIFLN